MRLLMMILLAGILCGSGALQGHAKTVPVSREEAAAWIDYTVPLPREIDISAKALLAPEEVAVEIRNATHPLVVQGVKELRETLGVTDEGPPAHEAAFTVTFEQGGIDSVGLRETRYPSQAYRILPDDRSEGIRLVGLAPRGLYYAGKTLQQLIRAKSRGGTLEIPVLRVLDWPDMEDRGLWGSDAYYHLRWLSDRKMNYMEQIAGSRAEPGGQHTVSLAGAKNIMVEEGPTYGIQPVPAILHLEQHTGRGLFEVYPELKGKGDCAEGAICYSNPLFIDVLADWIVGYTRMPGVTEVDIWLSENLQRKPGCQCLECRKKNRDVLEAETVARAWRKAQKDVPGVGIRVLTSEETEDGNEEILRALPKEVKVWYYHSLRTYSTAERPMVPPYLADAAAGGRWAGVCCNVSPGIRFPQPFTGAAFANYRMNEFVDKKMSGFLGYATPRVFFTAFNVEAVAEWSWNARGRKPSEFARSWAVREGLDEPDVFVEWAMTLGPVAWDVYGSEYPRGEDRNQGGNAAKRLEKGDLPELGFVLWDQYPYPWGDVQSAEQLDRNVAQAERAVRMAERMGRKEFIQESHVVHGYATSMKALWELRKIVRPPGIPEKKKEEARHCFQMYMEGLGQAKAALPEWEATLPFTSRKGSPAGKSVELIDEMITGMVKTARKMGIELAEM